MHNVGSRNCARCRLPLTDAASMNEGIGPICRKLDNALLARMIPSNVAAALAALSSISMAEIPAVAVGVLAEADAALNAPDAATREDWRKTVKQIEWTLSHGVSGAARKALYATVRALGYIALVNLWEGDATTGKATAFYLNGRIYFVGPNCKGGRMALRKIQGWNFHKFDKGASAWNAIAAKCDDHPAWSVPATHADAFAFAILSHWPGMDTKALAAAVSDAKAATLATLADAPAVDLKPEQAPCAAPAAEVVIEKGGALLSIRSPFRPAFIGKIKALPYSDRRWNGTAKAWEVAIIHEAAVLKIIADVYGSEPQIVAAAQTSAAA